MYKRHLNQINLLDKPEYFGAYSLAGKRILNSTRSKKLVESLPPPNLHSYRAKTDLTAQQEQQPVECYLVNATTNMRLYYIRPEHMNISCHNTIWTSHQASNV